MRDSPPLCHHILQRHDAKGAVTIFQTHYVIEGLPTNEHCTGLRNKSDQRGVLAAAGWESGGFIGFRSGKKCLAY